MQPACACRRAAAGRPVALAHRDFAISQGLVELRLPKSLDRVIGGPFFRSRSAKRWRAKTGQTKNERANEVLCL